MHCSDEESDHGKVFYPGPTLDDFDRAYAAAPEEKVTTEQADGTSVEQNFCLVPRCRECGATMKPHCMFFDEAYSEHYYRKDTVKGFVEESDCLIVVGTALATNLAKTIVGEFLSKELPVIEVNLESVINRGNNIQVLEKSEFALPALFKEYYRLTGQTPSTTATAK